MFIFSTLIVHGVQLATMVSDDLCDYRVKVQGHVYLIPVYGSCREFLLHFLMKGDHILPSDFLPSVNVYTKVSNCLWFKRKFLFTDMTLASTVKVTTSRNVSVTHLSFLIEGVNVCHNDYLWCVDDNERSRSLI